MTKITTAITFVLAAFVLAFGPAQAEERGSLEEAQAMAERAAAHIEEVGADAAFADFNEGGDWHDRDLYVFVFGPDGTNLSHGANQALIGTDMSGATDADGNHFIQEIVSVEDHGWVDYQFANPQTGEAEPKRSYVINVNGEYWVGVGAYVQ